MRPTNTHDKGSTRWWRVAVVAGLLAFSIGGALPAQAASAPTAPTKTAATSTGSSATLTWSPPPSDGGSGVTGYRLSRDGVDASGYGAWSGTVGGSARSATFGSLVVGSTYNLSVQAINTAGTSPASTVRVVAGKGQVVVPTMPTGVSGSMAGTSATVRWAPPASDGNAAITGYRIGRDGVDSAGFGAWSGTVAASTRSSTFDRLRPGDTYTLSVAAINAVGTGPASTVKVVISPSGAPMPLGDISGWRQVFTEDFTSTVALGSWPGSYSAKWDDYTDPSHKDTAGNGVWNTTADLSAAGGTADYYLHSVDGVPQSAAILPRTPTMTSGRYSVRFKVDSGLKGWASAWLLWPNDGVWPDHGEMDWPEGELTGTMNAFMHYASQAGGQDAFDSKVAFAGAWHTATTEWTPGRVRYLLNGVEVGTSTTQVSTSPMHWVLQTETAYGAKPTTSGHIKIDWAVVYTRA